MYKNNQVFYGSLLVIFSGLNINAAPEKLNVTTNKNETAFYNNSSKRNVLEQLIDSGIENASVKNAESEDRTFLYVVKNSKGEVVIIDAVQPVSKHSDPKHPDMVLLKALNNKDLNQKNIVLAAAAYAFIRHADHEQFITVNGKSWKCMNGSHCYNEDKMQEFIKEETKVEQKLYELYEKLRSRRWTPEELQKVIELMEKPL